MQTLRTILVLSLCGGWSSSCAADAIVVQNSYFPKPGQEQAVLQTRLEASEICRKLGLQVGRVLVRISDNDGRPYVMWECEYTSIEARNKDADATDASPAFRAVQDKMGTLLAKFDRAVWTVRASQQ